ncbi:hypothetical protein CEXT_371661 [Caerostris extrusa]|uniref:Uncharacterized protein n=1 Tax=Caerostris extrusa TaxID=172846 RepID=A0AAV4PV28_CAEEX|nr:hypothetical protein CEXT_371661 [Caerostris extrusa]
MTFCQAPPSPILTSAVRALFRAKLYSGVPRTSEGLVLRKTWCQIEPPSPILTSTVRTLFRAELIYDVPRPSRDCVGGGPGAN